VPVPVRELELDLDAFEGPFDLLLTLVLREEIALREVDLVAVVTAFGLLALSEGIDRLILVLQPRDTGTILIR